ncbi:MAG: DNA-protecting protein DprA [bacterium]|nr:DNA-protecting protein DprA [bacterium]
MHRRLSFGQAVFVAALPYRKSVYRAGGFASVDPTEPANSGEPANARCSSQWQGFLRRHFRSDDLKRAADEAAPYAGAANSIWMSSELERRTGFSRVAFVSVWDPEYPAALRCCYDAPPILFYTSEAGGFDFIGSFSHEPGPAPDSASGSSAPIAIVGTRQAHPLTAEAVRSFVAALAVSRPPIVSGLALGVDRLAHEAAIQNELPGLAVLGAGVLHAGPVANLDLLRRARAAGVPFGLVSEFPPHTPARAAHFPRRNRVIAGLVERVAVLQAPQKSGAMITARFALEEGRDVLVFDHAVLRAAAGCNDGARDLLESGATPIVLPELEARLLREPPFGSAGRARRLELWKRAALGQGLRWLGGRFYLESAGSERSAC